jgi:hypothetical protein
MLTNNDRVTLAPESRQDLLDVECEENSSIRHVVTYLQGTNGATIEELQAALGMSVEQLQKVLLHLLKHGYIKVISFLATSHDLYHSKAEENLAARAYRERSRLAATSGDTVTAELYEHIATEEDQHEKEFNTRLNNIVFG